jgi:predicted O-linked N-acetylglucosamine transferase (SPINDLY family)
MASILARLCAATADVWLNRWITQKPARHGSLEATTLLVLFGPHPWPEASLNQLSDHLRWRWIEIDRPPTRPGWYRRRLLARAVRRLAWARGIERVVILQLIMQQAYACDTRWRPDFADRALLDNPEIQQYVFDFPVFIDTAPRRAAIIDFIERLYADLDQLHGQALDRTTQAAIATAIAKYYSFMPALFADTGLKAIARSAGRWLETHLQLDGHVLDHDFPDRRPGAKIRLGVVVQNIAPRNESFLTLPFSLGLDRTRFQPILVTGRPLPDGDFGKLAATAFDEIVVIETEDLADRVARTRALDLDILILANTVTAQTSPLQAFYAHRLARRQILPVAICPHTTGLTMTDIVLTAANAEPPDAEAHYTEAIEWLDGTFNCFAFGPYDPRLAAADGEPAPSTELNPEENKPGETKPREPKIVFASGGVIHKLGPDLRRSFINILRLVPESTLLLYPFNPNWLLQPKILRLELALRAEFAAAGIAPERVSILPPLTPAEIVALMRRVTVYLDTFPFAGGASVIEPLIAHCPVVTLCGRTQRGLLGAGMLRTLGLHELIASDIADYEAKAVELARLPTRRATLSARLAAASVDAPFLDPGRFGRHLGRALERIATSLS